MSSEPLWVCIEGGLQQHVHSRTGVSPRAIEGNLQAEDSSCNTSSKDVRLGSCSRPQQRHWRRAMPGTFAVEQNTSLYCVVHTVLKGRSDASACPWGHRHFQFCCPAGSLFQRQVACDGPRCRDPAGSTELQRQPKTSTRQCTAGEDSEGESVRRAAQSLVRCLPRWEGLVEVFQAALDEMKVLCRLMTRIFGFLRFVSYAILFDWSSGSRPISTPLPGHRGHPRVGNKFDEQPLHVNVEAMSYTFARCPKRVQAPFNPTVHREVLAAALAVSAIRAPSQA